MHFLPENIGFATFLNCACSNALFTLCPYQDKRRHMETYDDIWKLMRTYDKSLPRNGGVEDSNPFLSLGPIGTGGNI